MHYTKGYSMNNKFDTVIYTLTCATLGATVIATKFFTDFSSGYAMPLTIGTAFLGIASVAGLIGVVMQRDAEIEQREMDGRFDDLWRHMARLEDQVTCDISKCHQRVDQEVDAIHNRFAVREQAAKIAKSSKS
jgi:hypothetical protein